MRRREMVVTTGGSVPTISIPDYSGTRVQTISPNYVYWKGGNVDHPLINFTNPSSSTNYGNDNYSVVSGDSVLFTIPANASCELKVVDLVRVGDTGRGNVRIGLRKAGDTAASISQPATNLLSPTTTPTTYTKSFTTEEALDVHSIFGRGTGMPRSFAFYLELYVNGTRWL